MPAASLYGVWHVLVVLTQIFWICTGVVGTVAFYRRDRRRFFKLMFVSGCLGIVAGVVTYIIVASTS
jgi:uncharacterized membrane protein HdeD (DUF308 family)